MKRKFIKVSAIGESHHIIPIDQICCISPKEGVQNKSVISLINSNDDAYSTETPSEILSKITLIQGV